MQVVAIRKRVAGEGKYYEMTFSYFNYEQMSLPLIILDHPTYRYRIEVEGYVITRHSILPYL